MVFSTKENGETILSRTTSFQKCILGESVKRMMPAQICIAWQ